MYPCIIMKRMTRMHVIHYTTYINKHEMYVWHVMIVMDQEMLPCIHIA